MTRTRKGIGTQKAKSQRELARRLNVSRSTVDRLRQDGLSCDAAGQYDLNEAQDLQRVRALRMRDAAAEGEQRREGALQLKESRLRVDLEMAEHKLAIARGEYVSRQAVSIAWRGGVIRIKNALLGLGRQIAPLLQGKGPREIQLIIDQRAFEILKHLANKDYEQTVSTKAEHPTLTRKET